MPGKAHTPEQIIHKLRQAEVELSQGATVPQACKKIRVTAQTYYRWRTEYGGLRLDQVRSSPWKRCGRCAGTPPSPIAAPPIRCRLNASAITSGGTWWSARWLSPTRARLVPNTR